MLIADEDHYSYNRIEILGDRSTYLRTMGLEWAQPDFSSVAGGYGDEIISGQATLQSSGGTSGTSVTDKTIYTVATLNISNITSEYPASDETEEAMSLVMWPHPPLVSQTLCLAAGRRTDKEARQRG